MRTTNRLVVLVTLVSIALSATAQVRRPSAAGIWYPADANELRGAVRDYLDRAEAPSEGHCLAVVAPSWSYDSCGDISAEAFAGLRPGQYDRVIVLAPSHHATFRGCSIAGVTAYRTPLGEVPLDGAAIRAIGFSPLVKVRRLFYGRNNHVPIHENEHAIEVVLPFLQVQLENFKLVPILVGSLEGYGGGTDIAAIDALADTLRSVVDDRTLIVVSTGFTRYGYSHEFVPWEQSVLGRIKKLDIQAFALLNTLDREGFQEYLKETKNPIDGAHCLSILLRLLPSDAVGDLRAYRTSAESNPDVASGTVEPKTSVSFAAIQFRTNAPSPPAP